jgi:hypothetical protein
MSRRRTGRAGGAPNFEVVTAADEEMAVGAALNINLRTKRVNRELRKEAREREAKAKIKLPKFSFLKDD